MYSSRHGGEISSNLPLLEERGEGSIQSLSSLAEPPSSTAGETLRYIIQRDVFSRHSLSLVTFFFFTFVFYSLSFPMLIPNNNNS